MCASLCAECTTLIAETPERVRQQRDQTERDVWRMGKQVREMRKRGNTRETQCEEEAK